MNKKLCGAIALLVSMFCTSAWATTDWSTQDYDLYPGDFDGDGKTDMLYVAKDPSRASGIARSDGSAPNIPFQSWPSNYLGIPWYGNNYVAIVADFNGDGRADIFLQRTVAGDHHLLLADSTGKITGISQTIANSSLGVVWSADQHRIAAGDFNGDGKSDLFLQTTSRSGLNAVMLVNSGGTFTTSPTQSWSLGSGDMGFEWSTAESIVYAGDFDGDGRADLLLQAKPHWVMIDYDVSFPVPTYPPFMNGVVLSRPISPMFQSGNAQRWNRMNFGVDWSPLTNNIVIGDFDGNGRKDVILQALRVGATSYWVSGNPSGAIFTAGTALASNVTWSADSVRLLVGNFNGSGGAGLFFQTLTPAGTNYYANTITGASVSLTTHDAAAPTSTLPVTAVGRTAGSFAVSALGSASYSIPIVVPPGVSGIQPQLELAYQSGGSNGFLGVGWALSGLSEIARCKKTLVQDGVNASITLTSGDVFCLDGNRLRPTGGSTYQTELETFSRITANGSAGNGPAYFVVEAKNGLKYEYGNSSDSRIESTASGFTTTPRAWALNKVSDRYGNAMTIAYQEDGAAGNGSFRPLSMSYTSNATTGLVSAYQVNFIWEARPTNDTLTQYVAGGLVREINRLKRIDTLYNDPIGGWRTVRKYQLGYNVSGSTPRSRLGAIQECDGSGNCLAPTITSWQNGMSGVLSDTSIGNIGNGSPYTLPIDFTGDGRTDLIYPTLSTSVFQTATCTWWFAIANSSGGYSSAVSTGVSQPRCDAALPIDYNVDGRMDFLLQTSAGQWLVLQSNGTGFSQVTTGIGAPAGGNKAWVTDIDGDGRQDLVSLNSDNATLSLFRNTGGALTSLGTVAPLALNSLFNSVASQGYWTVPKSAVQVADFNGDARADLLISYRDRTGTGPFGFTYTSRIGILRSTGTSFVLDPNPIASSDTAATIDAVFDSARMADFNGDGHVDLAYRCVSNSTLWCVRFGTGAGLGSEIVTTSSTGSDASLAAVLDWNGDGNSDLIETVSGNWQVVLSSGDVASPFAAMINTGISSSAAQAPRIVDANGDGLTDLAYADTSNNWHNRLHAGLFPDLLSSVTDGFGNSIGVQYAALTDSAVYTKGTGAVYPEMDLQAPIMVVKQYTATNGIADPGTAAGVYTVTESYTGARIALDGRGFKGFASRTEIDGRTGVKSVTTLRQDFPFIGAVATATIRQPNNMIIEETTNAYTDLLTSSTQYNDRHYPFASSVTHNAYEVSANATFNGFATTRMTTTTTVDSYGTPTTTTTNTYNMTSGAAVLTHTSVSNNNPTGFLIVNDATNWCLGFIQQAEVTNTPVGQTALTRTTRFTKDATALDKCRIRQKTVEPGHATLALTTTYGYDGFGHVNSETVSGPGMTNRVTTTNYGSSGVFPTSVTNGENETAAKTFYYDLGLPKSSTDANGLVMSWQYDGFGRKTREDRPDDTATTWTLYSCTNRNLFCGDSLLRYQIQEQQLDNTAGLIRYSVLMYDSNARVKYTQAQTLTGAMSNVAIRYDDQGRVSQRSQPYFNGGVGYFTTYTYDLVSRPLTESRQTSETDGSTRTISYAYERLVHKFTDANGRLTSKQMNALGQVTSVTDANSAVTQYQYDQFGNLKTATDSASNQIVTLYNVRGLKDSTADPDVGTLTYTYYPTGELKTQTDAMGNGVTFTYDRVGRQKTRVEPEGTTTSNYGASQANKDVGQLTTVTSPGSYSETYTYDSLGRVQNVQIVASATTFNITNSYSATNGLLDTVTYPTSTSAVTNSRFKVQYSYAYGQLQAVRDGYNSSVLYWQATAVDAGGHVSSEQYGNGIVATSTYDRLDGLLRSRAAGSSGSVQNLSYQWDKVGNLTQRRDLATSLTENFSYDNLNRLDYSQLNGVTNLDPTYDAIGNITFKTGVGTYAYTGAQTGCTYTGLTPQPHAVRNAGGVVYCYDKNGNMTKRGADALTWYSYNLPNQLTKGGSTATFSYGANRARYKQVSVTPAGQSMPAGTETTLYVGAGLFEKVTKPSGVIEYKHYIMAGSEAIAIRNLRSNSVDDTRYLHKDHLGSVDTITNEGGTVVTRLSYDAFGKRRDAGTWAGSPGTTTWTTIAGVTHRGFTFHEQLDNVDLVHMNGRVYDPNLGRFLSADPIIQAPFMSQSLNRYSYVMNNPLSMTDPSGFSWLSKQLHSVGRFLKKWGATIISVVFTIYGMPGIGAFISSVYSTAVNGGNLRSFIYGFGIGAAAGAIAGSFAGRLSGLLGMSSTRIATQIVQGTLAGGIAGGISASVMGGSFWGGFVGGAIAGGFTAGVVGAYEAWKARATPAGLGATFRNSAGEYTDEAPAGYQELLESSSEIRDAIAKAQAASEPKGLLGWLFGGMENGFDAYRRPDGTIMIVELKGIRDYLRSRIPYGGPLNLEGYTHLINFHTHPYTTCYGPTSCTGPWTALRGPSRGDQFFADRSPSAYAVIRAPTETLYYGPTAK